MTTRKQREEAKRIHRNQLQRERRHRKSQAEMPLQHSRHTSAIGGLAYGDPRVAKAPKAATGPIFTATAKLPTEDRNFVYEFPFGVEIRAQIEPDGKVLMTLLDSFAEGGSQGATEAMDASHVLDAVEAAHARSRANGAIVLGRAGFMIEHHAELKGV